MEPIPSPRQDAVTSPADTAASQQSTVAPARPAGLRRRLASLVYEALLLFAVFFLAGAVYKALFGDPVDVRGRVFHELFLLLVAGVYLMAQWLRGGQTLPMKTWRLRLESADGGPILPGQALLRYVCAVASCFLLGLGFLWALVDRDRQFLHDRMAGTRVVQLL